MSDTPPSISCRPANRTGVKTPGIAALAITASTAGPRESRSSRPLSTSVTMTCNATGMSSSRSASRWRVMTRRSLVLGTRWSLRPMKPANPVSGLAGNTMLRRRPLRTSASATAVSMVGGRDAMNAPLIAPTEVPTIRSGSMSRSNSACSMPTWIAPRLDPPDRTNARVIDRRRRQPIRPHAASRPPAP